MDPSPSPAQLIITAMITPALLIMGSASLVSTALLRLTRAVDRAREVLRIPKEEVDKLKISNATRQLWLKRYSDRAKCAERSVTMYFLAVSLFVIDCLTIAVDRYFGNALTWLPVTLTIVGMSFMLTGAVYMVWESRLATLQIREEIEQLCEDL